MFLSQLLEEYKESDEKHEIFKQFSDRLWKSKYGFKKYKKYYTYRVNEILLDGRQDLIELFSQYSKVEYTVCKSFYKKRLDYIDYIRIHINNMYGYLIDEDVYFRSEYYKLMLTPKKEYFRVITEIKNGGEVKYEDVKRNIDTALSEADVVKLKSIDKKIAMKFNAYKKLINTYLQRIFDNYIPVHEYEERHGWEMRINVDGWSEDSYVVRYFCKSLTGYMRNYIRDSKIELKYCKLCGKLIGRKGKYCDVCFKAYRRKYKTQKQKQYRISVDS